VFISVEPVVDVKYPYNVTSKSIFFSGVLMPSSTGVYSSTTLDTKDIPQAVLNIEAKSRSNPFPWNGQFSPQLIQALLNQYASFETVVLDPFVGSGTVLLEAGRIGLKAIGTEINPAAVILARVYGFMNIELDQRHKPLDKAGALLRGSFTDDLPMFSSGGEHFDSEKIKMRLIQIVHAVSDPLQQRLLQALVVLLDFYKPGLSTERVFAVWNRLAKLVLHLPVSVQPTDVFHADARKIPLPDKSVDLVITSPPYINVFNYHQQYRASTEALHWNLLSVARSEFGSNRKHRGNRFLTVIQYSLDIAQALGELFKLLRPKSRLIFVVGRESMVRGTRFYNGEIVAEVAHRALGYKLSLRQERVFTNRFGERIYEDILHFLPTAKKPKESYLGSARQISEEILKRSHKSAPAESKDDIKQALEQSSTVEPSPVFDCAAAKNIARQGA
jgi:SAM-dependent methyltransferase